MLYFPREVLDLNNKQNLHIHTTYGDGKDSPEALVQEALLRGFDSIGFSEHSYMPFSDYPYQMTVAQTQVYKAEIRQLQTQYEGQIDLFCGLEFEFYSDLPTDDFDYLIGSVHYLDCNGQILGFDRDLAATLAYIRQNFGGDGMAFAKQYYETVAQLPQKRAFDIVGHFDLLTKNNQAGQFLDVTDKAYLDFGKQAIHALWGKIPLFEVNTGAVARGYCTSPYPQMEFLKEFNRLGFGVVITSDCHDKAHLDCFYEESEQLLQAAGFHSRWILTPDGFQEVAL